MNPPQKQSTTPTKGPPKPKKSKIQLVRPMVSVQPIPSTSTAPTSSRIQKPAIPSTSKTSSAKSFTSTASEPSRESFTKNKVYPGFGSDTIKIIWDQYNDTDLTLADDVFPVMAEDASYKMYELINNIKTYSKHSGGLITCDLVNEVLKDSDCAPILGTPQCDWDKIECDGTVYFRLDETIELRKEYLDEVHFRELKNVEYVSTWVIHPNYKKYLLQFVESIINATLVGDEESYKYTLDTVASVAHIGPSIKIILQQCIQFLAFDQKPLIIERFLKLLLCISFNPYSRDVDARELFFHLSEVLVSLLMGPISSLKVPKNGCKEPLVTDDTEKTDVDDIRDYDHLYEKLLKKYMEEQTKKVNEPNEEHLGNIADQAETDDGVVPETFPIDPITEPNHNEKTFKLEKMEDVCVIESVFNTTDFECSPYHANMLYDVDINLLIRTIGSMGAHYGYFQHEMTFLICRNMDKIFVNCSNFQLLDYERISRGVRGLIALGEYAFRELIPFFSKLDPNSVPEAFWNDFALGAIFLKGRKDIYLYEYLEDLCGDRLQPYMLYAQRIHERLLRKNVVQQMPDKDSIPKIFNIRILKISTRNKHKNYSFTLRDYFPEYKSPKRQKKIRFNFAGCRQVLVKAKTKPNVIASVEPVDSKLSGIILIGRKLYKPSNIRPLFHHVPNPCFIHL